MSPDVLHIGALFVAFRSTGLSAGGGLLDRPLCGCELVIFGTELIGFLHLDMRRRAAAGVGGYVGADHNLPPFKGKAIR